MKFSKILATTFLLGISFLSQAQEFGLKESQDYIKFPMKSTETVVPVNSNKPVVVEFFWYGCPHCFKIKPLAEATLKKYEGKITTIRYPVGVPRWESGAKIFFTYQEMNILDKMHDKTFEETQTKQNMDILFDKKKRNAFLSQNGVDVKKFNSIYDSESINSKWKKAVLAVETNKIEGSPAYVIYSGEYAYQVSPALVRSYEKTAENMDKILAAKTK